MKNSQLNSIDITDIKLIKFSDSNGNDMGLMLKFIIPTREYITFSEFCKLCTEPKYSKWVISLCDMLGKISYPFYWECAPIKHVTDPMKIYLVKAQFNTRKADINTFSNQITQKNKESSVLHFPSATGSSELIIPNPLKSDNATKFTHIRNFMRYGNDKVRLAFWVVCMQAAQQYLKKYEIVYLKTHGHGVDYFHFRLQKTNAYYILPFAQGM